MGGEVRIVVILFVASLILQSTTAGENGPDLPPPAVKEGGPPIKEDVQKELHTPVQVQPQLNLAKSSANDALPPPQMSHEEKKSVTALASSLTKSKEVVEVVEKSKNQTDILKKLDTTLKEEKTTILTTAAPETTVVAKPGEKEEDEQAKDGVIPMSEEEAKESKKPDDDEDKEKFTEDEELPVEKDKGKGEIKQLPLVDSQIEAESEDGHFFEWMIMLILLVVIGYLAMHNKRKILALVFEGRSGRRGSSSMGRGGSARYRRLSQNEHENVIY